MAWTYGFPVGSVLFHGLIGRSFRSDMVQPGVPFTIEMKCRNDRIEVLVRWSPDLVILYHPVGRATGSEA